MTGNDRRLATAIAAALEALSAGDQREAVEILLSAQEDVEGRPDLRCPVCGLALRWPGELQHHLVAVHDRYEEEAA